MKDWMASSADRGLGLINCTGLSARMTWNPRKTKMTWPEDKCSSRTWLSARSFSHAPKHFLCYDAGNQQQRRRDNRFRILATPRGTVCGEAHPAPVHGIQSGVHSWSNVVRRRRPETAKSLVNTKTATPVAIGGNHQDLNSSGTSWLGPSQEPDNRSRQHLGCADVGSLPL